MYFLTKLIQAAGLAVIMISFIKNFPEIMDMTMLTLGGVYVYVRMDTSENHTKKLKTVMKFYCGADGFQGMIYILSAASVIVLILGIYFLITTF